MNRDSTDIILGRGYVKQQLKRPLYRAVEKYLIEFQKWSLPSVLSAWFDDIIDHGASSDIQFFRLWKIMN